MLRPGYDWFYPYYRDRALCLQLGHDALDQLLAAVAPKPTRIPARARCLRTGATRTQHRFALIRHGHAIFAGRRRGRSRLSVFNDQRDRRPRGPFQNDEVVYVSLGDGTTSEGEFWEALNTACNLKLPVVFLIEDNGYAIWVPVEVQTAGGSISKLVSVVPEPLHRGVRRHRFFSSYERCSRAVEYCRERRGPAFVHANVIRPYSHSLSDDEKLYRPEEERATDAERDPIKRFGDLLIHEGRSDRGRVAEAQGRSRREVNEAAERALASPQPPKETAMLYVYSPDVDPTSKEFDTEDQAH